MSANTPHPELRGRFLTGSTMSHVVRMTMAGATGITFVFVVDAANLFWISQLGDPRLVAAAGFAFAIQFFSVSIGIGLMIAAVALISRAVGEGGHETARHNATASMLLAGGAQALVALAVFCLRDQLVALTGATGETAALASRYLAISVPSIVFMALGMAANGALRAHGEARQSMFVTLFPGLVTMIVDPVMIYGLGWGLDGAAIGVALSRILMMSAGFYFAVRIHDLLARPAIADLRRIAWPFALIAGPAILTQMATPAGNYLMTRIMAGFGDDAVAGWAVVGRLTVVAFGGIMSLSGAIGGIFGQNYGARRFDRLTSTYRDAILFGFVYTLVAWLIIILASPLVIRGFGLTPEAAEVVQAFAYVGAGGFVFGAALFVSNAAFNALGRALRSTFVNWMRDGVVTLPLALLLAAWFGAQGVIYAQAVASLVVGSLAGWWGWHFVRSLHRKQLPPLDLPPPRPYANPDRFRRR